MGKYQSLIREKVRENQGKIREFDTDWRLVTLKRVFCKFLNLFIKMILRKSRCNERTYSESVKNCAKDMGGVGEVVVELICYDEFT